MKLKEQAAAAISKAFNDAARAGSRRTVKVVFVLNSFNGRIQGNDMMTLKLVLRSIHLEDEEPLPANCYGVIVNKCTFLQEEDFINFGKTKMELMFGDKSLADFPTFFVKFVPQIDELVNASNKIHNIDGLREWVLEIPGVSSIKSADLID